MDTDRIGCGGLLFFILLLIAFVLGGIWIDYRSPQTIQGVVTDTYIKRYNDNDYFHVVVEFENGTKEVFQNRDAFFIGKFNSADLQLEFKVGEGYLLDVRGTRLQLFSKFRNITDAEPVSR